MRRTKLKNKNLPEGEKTETFKKDGAEENLKPDDGLKNVQGENKSTLKTHFYIGIALGILGAAAFVLTLVIPNILGVYGLICAILFELGALAFFSTQKKKNDFKALLYVKIAAYGLLFVFTAFFIGGIIYTQT